jgi:hypothetical protein
MRAANDRNLSVEKFLFRFFSVRISTRYSQSLK